MAQASACALLAFIFAAHSLAGEKEARAAEARGDYSRMLAEARIAAGECRAARDQRCEARALNLIGGAYFYLNNPGEARKSYQQALELARAAKDIERQVFVLNNLGGLEHSEGRYSEAWRRYAAAEMLAQTAEQRQWTWANEAALLQRLGRDGEALKLYQRLKGEMAGAAPSERARMLSNLGALNRRLGDPYKALALYQQALALFEKDRNFDGQIGVLKNLGIAEAMDFKRYADAERRFDQVIRLAESRGGIRDALQARLYLAETLWRQGRRAEAESAWRLCRESARIQSAPDEEWKALLGLGRAASMDGRTNEAVALLREAADVIENMRGSLDSSALKLEFLSGRREVYDALIGELITRGAPAGEIYEWIERARSRMLLDALGAAGPAILPLAEIQSRLAPDEAMALFWAPAEGGAVVVIRREGTRVVRLGLSRGWQDRLQKTLALVENEHAQGWRDALRPWGELLLAPAGLFSARGLVVVPDGALALLPFEALPAGGRLAIEQWEVSYLPAATLRSAKPVPRWRKWPWEKQALVIGLARAEGLLPGDERWQEMPRAEEEALAVGKLLPGENRVVVGPESNTGLLESPGGYGVLHLATHAAADLEDPARSRILLPQPGDPYLTLPEVASFDLRAVSLVTLSACETERGRLIRGEGVQSFGRAFLQAGAGAVVSSLWPVEDHATKELMQQFYAELGRSARKGQALREAKLRLLHSDTRLSHPANWAGFILTGDAASPLDLPATWADLLTGGALLAGFVSFLGLWVRPRLARLPDVQVRVRAKS